MKNTAGLVWVCLFQMYAMHVHAARVAHTNQMKPAAQIAEEPPSEEPALEPLVPLPSLDAIPSPPKTPDLLWSKPAPEPVYAVRVVARPWYQQWWFYTLLGGVVSAGIATGIVLGTQSPSSDPSFPSERPDAVWSPGSSHVVWY